MKNIIWFILGNVVALLICLVIIPKQPTQHYIIDSDTITITDTFTQYFPDPIEVIRWKDTTIFVNDTTYIVLPFEKKRYQTDNYDLTISGFEPQLDEITVFPEKKYIYYTTVLNEEKKKVTFNHGIQGGFGYGLINKKLDIYLGYGFQISF